MPKHSQKKKGKHGSSKHKGKHKEQKEKVVDKRAPKKAMSAFFWYMKVRRESLKKEEPNVLNYKMNIKMAEEWRALQEQDKSKYVAMAEADKTRYINELKVKERKALQALSDDNDDDELSNSNPSPSPSTKSK